MNHGHQLLYSSMYHNYHTLYSELFRLLGSTLVNIKNRGRRSTEISRDVSCTDPKGGGIEYCEQ